MAAAKQFQWPDVRSNEEGNQNRPIVMCLKKRYRIESPVKIERSGRGERPGGSRERRPDRGQQESEPGQEAAEVVADSGEHGIACIAGQTGEMVAANSVFGLGMADDRLNGRPSPHLAFDCVRHPPLLAGGTDLEAMFG